MFTVAVRFTKDGKIKSETRHSVIYIINIYMSIEK